MTAETDHQLVRLASDDARVYQDAQRWFLERGEAIAPALVDGLGNRGLGAVGRWRILLLLRELQLPWTLPAILKTFSEALAEGNPIVLPGAMEALAVFGSEDALAALIAALASGDRDAVNHAAALIGKRGGARAQEALTALLRHPDAAHRRSAVRGLLLMDTEPARDILRRHRATEQDPGVLELLEDLR